MTRGPAAQRSGVPPMTHHASPRNRAAPRPNLSARRTLVRMLFLSTGAALAVVVVAAVALMALAATVWLVL